MAPERFVLRMQKEFPNRLGGCEFAAIFASEFDYVTCVNFCVIASEPVIFYGVGLF